MVEVAYAAYTGLVSGGKLCNKLGPYEGAGGLFFFHLLFTHLF
jgi:hypothetical protein